MMASLCWYYAYLSITITHSLNLFVQKFFCAVTWHKINAVLLQYLVVFFFDAADFC